MSRSKDEVVVEEVEPTSAAARVLIDELSTVLAEAYGSSGRSGYQPEQELDGVFLIARLGGELAGCGALRSLDGRSDVAEVKRMYSRPGTTGVGQAVLRALESQAAQRGYASIWLETRRANSRAVRFYMAAGYRERAPYGQYVGRPEAICMEKVLPGHPTGTTGT